MSLSSNPVDHVVSPNSGSDLDGSGYPSAADAEASILSQFKSSIVRDSDLSAAIAAANGNGKRGAAAGSAGMAAEASDEDDDGEGGDGDDDNLSTNNDEAGGNGGADAGGPGSNGSNKRIKVEYSTTDPEARRKERNRIHAQKARLRKKTLLRDMKLVRILLLVLVFCANLCMMIVDCKSGE